MLFRYKAKTSPGKTVKGTLEAGSRADALSRLADKGIFPISVHEAAPEGSEKRVSFFREASSKDLSVFTRQLSDLLESGLPVLKALRVVRDQTENARLSAVLGDMAVEVERGVPLSRAMGNFPRIFSPIYIGLVRAGEAAGVLSGALSRLSDFTEREDELKSKIQAALAYPLLILSVGVGTVIFLMVFVVPKLSVLFMEMGEKLPPPTLILMAVSGGLKKHGWIFILGATAAASPFFVGKSALRAREAVDRLFLDMPLWGSLAKKVAIARFARTLGTLLGTGVPILDALAITSGVLGHERMREQVMETAGRLKDGAGLAESLREMPDFPAFMCNMIAVGEEGNTLEKSLNKVAATYERESDRAVKIFTSLIEPLLILGVGSVIALIVMATLLPVFQIPAFVK